MTLPKMGKKMEWNCGNEIAEIGLPKQVKFFFWQLWQCHCRKWEEKKLVVAKIWEGIKKKKVLRSQYFYNIFTTNHR